MPRRKNFLVFGSPLIEEGEIAEVVACLPFSPKLSDDITNVTTAIWSILN